MKWGLDRMVVYQLSIPHQIKTFNLQLSLSTVAAAIVDNQFQQSFKQNENHTGGAYLYSALQNEELLPHLLSCVF